MDALCPVCNTRWGAKRDNTFEIVAALSKESHYVMHLLGLGGRRWTSFDPKTPANELPAVILKAVLTYGDRTSEGMLVEAVSIPWFKIVDMIKNDPGAMYSIAPRVWEEIIAGAYREAGFDDVVLTPRSGDKGRDVIATKNGIGSIRILDQVKAYKPGHLVTADEVRAMLGGCNDGPERVQRSRYNNIRFRAAPPGRRSDQASRA